MFHVIKSFIKQKEHAQTAKRKKEATDKKNSEAYFNAKNNYNRITQIAEAEILTADISQLHRWMIEGKLLPT